MVLVLMNEEPPLPPERDDPPLHLFRDPPLLGAFLHLWEKLLRAALDPVDQVAQRLRRISEPPGHRGDRAFPKGHGPHRLVLPLPGH